MPNAESGLIELSEKEAFVFDSDMIGVIEKAEKKGLRKQNFIGLIRDHFNLAKINRAPDHELKNQEAILHRILPKKDHKIWIFLDEIDQYFNNDQFSIKKVGAMFLATRELTGCINNLIIRITIKPNVFAIIESKIDSISNLREFVFDLTWSPHNIRQMLARRVDSYLERNLSERRVESIYYGTSKTKREEWLISQIFDTKRFDLGRGNRPPHIILTTLAGNIPRRVLSLSKLSAKVANKEKSNIILFDHVEDVLRKFGQNTIKDISAEYSSLCKKISKVIYRFNGAPKYFKDYSGLIKYIDNRIKKKLRVRITGIAEKADAKEIANFLYYIGFIDARKHITAGRKYHVQVSDLPDLLSSQYEDKYDDYFWEVKPGYRNVLNIGMKRNKHLVNQKKKKRKKTPSDNNIDNSRW